MTLLGFAPAVETTQRQRCEVWSRVMGYHRPVVAWNSAKRQEHADRKFFLERKQEETA